MAGKSTEGKALTMEEVQAQIQSMLDEARKEAQRIVEEAKGVDEKAAAEREAQKAEELARGEELVEVKLFKDNNKYKDPVFVGVNGETVAIERGVRVKVKRKFAEVLDNSDRQDYETSLLIEQKSEEFKKSGL